MLELVVFACLVSSPLTCNDHVVANAPDHITNPTVCASLGQPEIARWAGENPNWAVASWRCRKKGKKETDV